jgi:anti-sigma regulatory factor (Ser/Thr protein kinase)
VSAAEVALRPEPASVREARRYVSDELTSLGLDDAAMTAELLVSELVTNAILHARTPVRLSVVVDGEVVRVAVADDSPRAPRQRQHSLDSGTGRGLLLVERMANRWGVDVGSAGKVVWFELSREPAELVGGWDDAWEA